jgi:hypothetical protein
VSGVPDSFQALAVATLGLLPGALYIWSFEGVVGRWGAGLSDRVLRFVGSSALLHAGAAPITYRLWSEYGASGRLARGESLPLVLWTVVLAYVLVPIWLGWVVGYGARQRWKWTLLVTGRNPAPRAWDSFFGDDPEGWVRLRLKSGAWIGAALGSKDGRRSYAAGYPEDQDLYFVQTAEVDPETGEFLYEGDQLRVRDSGLLLRWDEVEYLEFFEG